MEISYESYSEYLERKMAEYIEEVLYGEAGGEETQEEEIETNDDIPF